MRSGCIVRTMRASCRRQFHSFTHSDDRLIIIIIIQWCYSNTTITAIAATTIGYCTVSQDEGLPRRETCAATGRNTRFLVYDATSFSRQDGQRAYNSRYNPCHQILLLQQYQVCVYYDLCGGNRIPSGAAHRYTPKCREKKIPSIKINRFTYYNIQVTYIRFVI